MENYNKHDQSNIYLNRLKKQYKEYKNAKVEQIKKKYYSSYANMRLFCLDTELVSFNDIEAMEYEVNQSF